MPEGGAFIIHCLKPTDVKYSVMYPEGEEHVYVKQAYVDIQEEVMQATVVDNPPRRYVREKHPSLILEFKVSPSIIRYLANADTYAWRLCCITICKTY